MIIQESFVGRRKFLQFGGGADGPPHLLTTTIRTHVVEVIFCAVRAKGALKGADSGVRCIGRQVLVTAFTVRLED